MWTRISSLLFQNRCVFCQESAPTGRDVCQFCVADLPVSEHSCKSCAMPLAESSPGRCGICLRQSPPVRRTVAYCHYAYPTDFLVQQLKFAGQLKYARVMGSLLAEAVEAAEPCNVDLIIPIPLSTKRYRERGFNQAAEIARFVGEGLSRPVSDRLLYRCLHHAPQAGLDRRRRASNIRGAFKIQKKLAGEHCALVDDVMTTGATAYEAATALMLAGAGSVDLWVFARTV